MVSCYRPRQSARNAPRSRGSPRSVSRLPGASQEAVQLSGRELLRDGQPYPSPGSAGPWRKSFGDHALAFRLFRPCLQQEAGLVGPLLGREVSLGILNGIRQFAIAFGYIDENPVKAGLADRACEWLHSGAWHSRMGDRSILDEEGPLWLALLGSLRPLPLALPIGSVLA